MNEENLEAFTYMVFQSLRCAHPLTKVTGYKVEFISDRAEPKEQHICNDEAPGMQHSGNIRD